MKRILTSLLILLLLATLALPSMAATVKLSDYLEAIKSSYKEKTQLTTFEETLAMSSLNWLRGRTAFYPENEGTAASLSRRILAYSATATVPDPFPEADELVSLQEGDGSFGNLEIHCLSMLALRSIGKTYNSPKAYEFVLSKQNEDGSFGDSIKETALAITVLTLSENEQELKVIPLAAQYLYSTKTTTLPDLCWQMIGLTDAYNSGDSALKQGDATRLERLLSYTTGKGTFSMTVGSAEGNEEATALVLLTLDAVNRDKSALKRLATDGLMKHYNFKPLIVLVCIMLAISLAFWVFVIFHKKPNKTLEETKNY